MSYSGEDICLSLGTEEFLLDAWLEATFMCKNIVQMSVRERGKAGLTCFNSTGKPPGPEDLPLCIAAIAEVLSLVGIFSFSSEINPASADGIFKV